MLPDGRHLPLQLDELPGISLLEQESALERPTPTGFALLLPGLVAYRLGKPWIASVFILSALTSLLYHVAPTSSWAPRGLHYLRLLDSGCLYFCVLQLGFLIMGPEDLTESKTSRTDLLLTRMVPTIAMLLFLCSCNSWQDFPWQCLILLDSLWLLGFIGFWLQPARRAIVGEVLLRSNYWLRLYRHAFLPTIVLSLSVLCLASLDPNGMPQACTLVFALLAARVILTSHGQEQGETRHLQELQGLSPSWNPMVARQILAAPSVLGVATIGASLVADMLLADLYWPLLSMPVHSRPGGYLVILGALPALVAMAAALRLVSSASACHNLDLEEKSAMKHMGCCAGYGSILLATVKLVAHLLASPLLQQVTFLSSMILMAASILLTTLATGCTRCMCFSSICAGLLVTYIVLSILEQWSSPMPEAILALSEYVAVAAYLVWPLAWVREVHSSWQLHKAWPSRPIQMA